MSQIATCPNCSRRLRVSEQITDKTLICPHCLADVDNPRPGTQIRAPELDTDVKRDVSVGSKIIAVLIGLCVLGIALAFFVGHHSQGKGESGLGEGIFSLLLLMNCFGALDILVSIAIIRRLIRRSTSGVPEPSVGRVIGIAVLSLGSVVAVVIFFFFTCVGLVMLSNP